MAMAEDETMTLLETVFNEEEDLLETDSEAESDEEEDQEITVYDKLKTDDKLSNNIKDVLQLEKSLQNALTLYTRSVAINRALRDYFFSREQIEMLKRMDMAFRQVRPLEEDIIVFRGIKPIHGNEFFKQDLGFTSTSIYLRTTLNAEFIGEDCCLLVIIIRKGSKIIRIPREIGHFDDDNEVLLFRGGTFREIHPESVHETYEDRKMYYLEYLENPLMHGAPEDWEHNYQVMEYMTEMQQNSEAFIRRIHSEKIHISVLQNLFSIYFERFMQKLNHNFDILYELYIANDPKFTAQFVDLQSVPGSNTRDKLMMFVQKHRVVLNSFQPAEIHHIEDFRAHQKFFPTEAAEPTRTFVEYWFASNDESEFKALTEYFLQYNIYLSEVLSKKIENVFDHASNHAVEWYSKYFPKDYHTSLKHPEKVFSTTLFTKLNQMAKYNLDLLLLQSRHNLIQLKFYIAIVDNLSIQQILEFYQFLVQKFKDEANFMFFNEMSIHDVLSQKERIQKTLEVFRHIYIQDFIIINEYTYRHTILPLFDACGEAMDIKQKLAKHFLIADIFASQLEQLRKLTGDMAFAFYPKAIRRIENFKIMREDDFEATLTMCMQYKDKGDFPDVVLEHLQFLNERFPRSQETLFQFLSKLINDSYYSQKWIHFFEFYPREKIQLLLPHILKECAKQNFIQMSFLHNILSRKICPLYESVADLSEEQLESLIIDYFVTIKDRAMCFWPLILKYHLHKSFDVFLQNQVPFSADFLQFVTNDVWRQQLLSTYDLGEKRTRLGFF